jgi:hypothetical protein
VAIRETESVAPCADDAAVYAKGPKVYQALYPALKSAIKQI